MPRRFLFFVASFLLAMPASARAQGGLLDPTTEYQMITGPRVGNQHGKPQAIVLWRGPLGWDQPRTDAERQQSDSIFRWTRLHADESHQSIGGSGLWYVLVDDDHSAVTVEGKRFPLAPGDSALVVMVTVPPNGPLRAVTTAKIGAADVPDEFWIKQWHSGDTSFTVFPDFRKQQSMLRAALTRSPAVAAFLESPSSTAIGSSPARSIDVLVPVQGKANEANSLVVFHPDLPAVDGPFECTGIEQIGATGIGRTLLGPKAVSISAAFPNRAEERATVVVVVDSAGNIIRYAERRGPAIHPVVKGKVPTAAEVVAAASAVRSTMITLDYRKGSAIVENRGGGSPDEIVFGPVGVVDSMERFGKPAERAARVVAQCKDRR
jgi:hypothetical protein